METRVRRAKSILFFILAFAIGFIATAEIWGATQMYLRMQGEITYSATEIGAKIWGTYSVNSGSTAGTASWMSMTGGSGSSSDGVYTVSGRENELSGITCNLGTFPLEDTSKSVELMVFVKNIGDRYILPNVTISPNVSYLDFITDQYYYNYVEGASDLLAMKPNYTATSYVSAIKGLVSNSTLTAFQSNSSIDQNDTYVIKVSIKLNSTYDSSIWQIESTNFVVSVSFMADIQYTSNDILSIYQDIDQTDPSWTKYGYNATLNATATKVNETSLSNIAGFLQNKDSLGNPNITYGQDDYLNAVVYKDIDIVNVDLATGEIIGKLSDPTYPFEWFGRSVTLPAGRTLASGRTLSAQTTFSAVDCYTYFPTMYLRRWVVGDRQWQSLSNKFFMGSVKIDEFYLATFEATLFNPDKTTSDVPRSYIATFEAGPLTSGSINYALNNWSGYSDTAGVKGNSTNQQTMQSYMTTLTNRWNSSSLASSYKKVKGVQGENWKMYAYDLLYLVKYANNNSQEMVGYGCTWNYDANSQYADRTDYARYYESEKPGGTVTTYSNSTLSYGFSYNYTNTNSLSNGSDPKGLYSSQFMVKNIASSGSSVTRRVLSDGFVGTDRYSSVFCLGICNPWGNVWEWSFGQAVVSNGGTSMHMFVNFDDFNGSNWLFNSYSGEYANKKTDLKDRNYIELSYTLPTEGGYKSRYNGTSNIVSEGALEQLVGVPTSAGSDGGSTTGRCDYYWVSTSTDYIFGVLRGGYVGSHSSAGLFSIDVSSNLTHTSVALGFRPSLISS